MIFKGFLGTPFPYVFPNSLSNDNVLKSLSPKSKASALDLSLTPKTKKSVFDSHNLDEGTGMALFKKLSKNKDKLSNCTRRLVLGNMTLTNKVARINWTSVRHAVHLSATKVLIHYQDSFYG